MIEKPSIDLLTEKNLIVATVTEATSIEEDLVTEKTEKPTPDWRTEFIDYLADGKLPLEKWAVRRLKTRSPHYVVMDGNFP